MAASLVNALIHQESGFNRRAISNKGTMGLMPDTADYCGITNDYDAEQNLIGGIRYLAQKLDKYHSIALALAAYHAGDSAVEKYKGIPPFRETQQYVKSVLSRLGYGH